MKVDNTKAYQALSQAKATKRQAKKDNEKEVDKNTQNSTQKDELKDKINKSHESLKKELAGLSGKNLMNTYLMRFSQQSFNTSFSQSLGQLNAFNKSGNINAQLLGLDFTKESSVASVLGMIKSPQDAAALIADDGFFGMENTANRIADFVIQGAGDDINRLKKGFEGMKQGFEDAQKMWGGKLPQISQDTIAKAIEKVSERMKELGGNNLDLNA